MDHLCSLSNCFAGGYDAALALPLVREKSEAWGEENVRLLICASYIVLVIGTLCIKNTNVLNIILGIFMLGMVCLFAAVVYQISIKGNISWDK